MLQARDGGLERAIGSRRDLLQRLVA